MTQFKDKSAKGGEGVGQRRPVHLPDPPGGRHPALPPALRPRRRGPAPAPRAHPRPREAVQPPLQEDVPAARALHPQGHREDRRPAGPDRQDVEVRSSPSGIVEMLDDPAVSAKKIRSAVTDSGSEVRFDADEKPGVSNLLTIYSALTDTSIGDLEEKYAGKGYGDLKTDLAEVVVDFVTPFRERTLELLDDQDHLMDVLRQGARGRHRGRRGDPARRLPAGRVRRPAPRPDCNRPTRLSRCRPSEWPWRSRSRGPPSCRTTAPPSATPPPR